MSFYSNGVGKDDELVGKLKVAVVGHSMMTRRRLRFTILVRSRPLRRTVFL